MHKYENRSAKSSRLIRYIELKPTCLVRYIELNSSELLFTLIDTLICTCNNSYIMKLNIFNFKMKLCCHKFGRPCTVKELDALSWFTKSCFFDETFPILTVILAACK